MQETSTNTPIDPRAFRDALGCFATGVTVITTQSAEGELIGITANSFSSVSLDPPLILFSLARHAYSLEAFLSAHHFAVNILHEGQDEISERFARTSTDKWVNIEYESWESGCPILCDCLAAFECFVRHTYHGGDHVIIVGEVTRMRADPDGRPLLFLRGRYGVFGNAT